MHFFQTNTFPLTGPLSQTCQPGLQCTPLTPLVRLPQGSSLSTSTVHPPPQAGQNVFCGESSRYSNCSVKALGQFSEALKPRDQGIAQGKSQGRLYAFTLPQRCPPPVAQPAQQLAPHNQITEKVAILSRKRN